MTTAVGTARRRSRAVATLVVAAVAVGGLSLVSGNEAGAASKAKKNEAKVSNATMAWAVSQYVLVPNFASLSVAEVHNSEPPATFAEGTGWTFTDGKGTYNTKSGAMTVAFPGSLEFGNTSRGNYSFKFASPTFALDATGTGTLTADVSVRPAGATAYNPSSKVVVVDVVGTEPTKTKNEVTVTAAPTAFSAPLIAAVGDLAAHFQTSGSSNDANKPPAPITVEFGYKVKSSKS
jgi:hypothetical protein